jgi:catechol 2,3-dioxygenase-like lactoylglutathione lyase family enzyme
MTPLAQPATFRIGYVDLHTPALPEALAYYTEVIGAKVVERDSTGAVYLSLGLYHHDIVLRPAQADAAPVVGYQLRPDLSLADFAKRLGELGVKAERRGDARPGVGETLQAQVCGNTFEFFHEIATPAPGFSASGVAPNRIGHVALINPDAPKLITFFTDGLGFAETDWFDHVVTFLTCNRDHHVMNVIHAPIVKFHHIAFELRGQSAQFLAADLLARFEQPVLWGPSRHTAGHNLASYHYGPDRQLIELYTDMDVYLREVGYFEPRPWHDVLPQRPRRWALQNLTTWHTPYEFDFSKA